MSRDGKIKGYVYKIYSLDEPELLYVGSTASSLIDRLNRHKGDYRRWKNDNKKNYVASYKIFEKHGVDNIIIDKLEKLYFKERGELLRLEGKFQRELICVNIVTNNDTEKVQWGDSYYYKPEREEKEIDLEKNPFKQFIYKG
jgi:hypothetical protein